jgi:ribosomal protein L29
MAILRAKDAMKLSQQDRVNKIKELKLELVRAQVSSHKANSKTKEIKRAISRILTYERLNKTSHNKEKELRKK